MTQPLPPESETPRTDAVLAEKCGTIVEAVKLTDLARDLERSLTAAQTELKGCYRIVDELKEELRQAQEENVRLREILLEMTNEYSHEYDAEFGTGNEHAGEALDIVIKARAALNDAASSGPKEE